MDTKEQLEKIGQEIRDLITIKQKELNLSFVEDTHTYHIRDKHGNMTTKFPSVSTVIGQFYEPFPDLNKSYQMCDGDLIKQDELLKDWRATADYANKICMQIRQLLDSLYSREQAEKIRIL